MTRNLRHTLYIATLAALTVGCSTTKRLASDEVLYTGVKKISIQTDSSGKLAGNVESAVMGPLSVRPNNPLVSPYVRTPLPIGLWAYNYLYTPKEKGFKHWLYGKFAKSPVLISKIRPELRTQWVSDILGGYGYFGSTATYALLPRRNPKKARLSYSVQVGKPWFIDSIGYPRLTGSIGTAFDSLQRSSLLRPGMQYDTDSLAAERERISDSLRDNGYYFFRPDYIDYQADTTQRKERVQLRMQVKANVPEVALKPYTTGRITVQLHNIRPSAIQDTVRQQDYRLIYQPKLKIRPRVLSKSILLDSGERFRISDLNGTLTNLNKLGIFSSVNAGVTSPDSLHGRDTLDVLISAAYDYPLEAELEMNVTSKSNSLLGPGLSLRLSNNNLFKGGEVLSLRLTGSYEWQTGNRNSGGGEKSSLLNSYEFGLNATLEFPKLIFPGLFSRVTKYPSRSRVQLGADLLNRPNFFRILSFNTSLGYDWQTSPVSYHSVSILKLTYNRLLNTSAAFDSTMQANPIIELSFRDQFIPSCSYTYTFDKTYSRNRLYWQTTATTAGNILEGVFSLLRKEGPHKIFGNPFSQFIKGTSDIRFYYKLGQFNWLATRFMIGAAHPYGNASVIPYNEQFYIGGANSIRAFTIRSLGPGSYRPPASNKSGYLDQTGTFKLEANIEFRFRMIGRLNGAVFLDAGNIWLLKADPQRPGAELTWKGLGREIALGTGVGLRYDISYIVLRLDCGIGLHTPYANPDKPGYYNISSFKDGLGLHLAIGYPF